MHERREEIFFKRRLGLENDYSEEVKDTLADIVHEQFQHIASIDMDCDVSEQVEHAAVRVEPFVIKEESEGKYNKIIIKTSTYFL